LHGERGGPRWSLPRQGDGGHAMGAPAISADDIALWVACVGWVAAGVIPGALAGRVLRSGRRASVGYVFSGIFGAAAGGGFGLLVGAAEGLSARSALSGSVVAAFAAACVVIALGRAWLGAHANRF